jgi:hypothetical protein
MKMSQGNSLCKLFLSQTSKNVIFFSFYLFSSAKSKNRRAGEVLPTEEGLAPVGRGRWGGMGVGE